MRICIMFCYAKYDKLTIKSPKETLRMKMRAPDINKEAISPFAQYCDGYGCPGAKGLGYISVIKVATGSVEKTSDSLLDGIVAYDLAEANEAYIGQINMVTASSFCGLAGQVWGYDLAVADEIKNNSQKTIFTAKQYDGTPLPVYDGTPLLLAGKALFGTESNRGFPPAPGSHIICANKSITSLRPTNNKPDPLKNEAFGVWCYIAISIARDRDSSADLLIEDAGLWTKNDDINQLKDFLKEHRKTVVLSIIACGQQQSVIYDRTYISYAFTIMQPNYIGTALAVAPYIVLAQNAIPNNDFESLNRMMLSEWENAVKNIKFQKRDFRV